MPGNEKAHRAPSQRSKHWLPSVGAIALFLGAKLKHMKGSSSSAPRVPYRDDIA